MGVPRGMVKDVSCKSGIVGNVHRDEERRKVKERRGLGTLGRKRKDGDR